jgi:hypothetical protein
LLLASWRRHMTAQRMSPATLSTYSAAVGQLDDFLETQGMPRAVPAIRREHLEAFITDLLEKWKPKSPAPRGRSPQRTAPPATGFQGAAFVVTDRGDRSAVYAIDPSGRITGRWQTHDGLAWAGFCEPCSTGCGHMRVVPVVGGDGTLYVALGGGSVAAVGPDGGTRVGWPVTLRRPGASFWSLATDTDGTVFALAIEPEPGATPECEYPPASATILAIDPAGSVRARVTVVEP